MNLVRRLLFGSPEPDPMATCPECGKLNRTHYSGSTEREGKRLGISKHNPFPDHIDLTIPDSPQHVLEKAVAEQLRLRRRRP